MIKFITKSQCLVVTYGWTQRKKCFDVAFPFFLQVRKYHCQTHNKYFLISDQDVIEKLPAHTYCSETVFMYEKFCMVIFIILVDVID